MQEKINFAHSIQVSFGKIKTKYFLHYIDLTQIKCFTLFFNWTRIFDFDSVQRETAFGLAVMVDINCPGE